MDSAFARDRRIGWGRWCLGCGQWSECRQGPSGLEGLAAAEFCDWKIGGFFHHVE